MVLLGLSNVGSAQKIVINEADSSWKGEEIPSDVLSKKKFTFSRRLYQNLVTRFNYYYNADRIMKEVLEGAQRIHQDNYDSVLTFYPYTVKDMQQFEGRLDSVILTAGIGIQVHDPRGKWIDDLYFLIGQANFFKEKDSEAIAAFRYIIKNNGEKDEEGRPELIGSRAFHSEENISIVSPEKKKNLSHPPARNDAFLWLIRAYRQAGAPDAAAALFNSLQADPRLPERLRGKLIALEAERYLREAEPDSALSPLKQAIALQPDKQLKARWQFILAQLYEEKGQWEEAFGNYGRVELFSPTPLMNFYARLSQTRIRVLRDLHDFGRSSEPLLTMARKEKYSRFRSIIYYNLGKLALQAGYPGEGIGYLKKSLNYNPNKTKTHFRAYSLLATYFYDHYDYRNAKAYYDSAAALAPAPDPVIDLRQRILAEVVKNLDIISKEDSLRSLAFLPRDSLMEYLNGIVNDSLKMRKKRNRILEGPATQKNGLFGLNNKNLMDREEKKNSAGGWYFYNNTAKAQGFSEFKTKWGTRKLGDDWRLSHPNQPVAPAGKQQTPVLATASQPETKEGEAGQLLRKLLDPLPLSPGKLKASDSLKMEARHRNVNLFFTQLESDTATLMAIDSLLKWHPQNPYLDDLYYKLYLIYSRMPNAEKAAYYKQLLQSRFGTSRYAALLNEKPANNGGTTLATTIMHLYDSAYISYLTGSYGKIPKLRDSALYLDPRNKQKGRFNLLNAMMILKTRSDSAGIIALNRVIREEAADTPIVDQARRILNALQHKDDLVEHLMNLQLKEESAAPAKTDQKKRTEREKPVAHPALSAIVNNNRVQTRKEPPAQNLPHQVNPVPDLVGDSLQKKRFREEALKELAKKRADSLAAADSLQKAAAKPLTPYKVERQIPYFVILSFNHINGDLIKNTLQAFSEYNHSNHAGDSIEVSSFVLSHNQVVLIFRLFKNETGALLYYQELKKKAAVSIIPQVPASYYRLFFISRSNFVLLNNTQDFKGYLDFFYKHYK